MPTMGPYNLLNKEITMRNREDILLDVLKPMSIGFDHIFDHFEQLADRGYFHPTQVLPTYPFYNMKEKDNKGLIEFAVAGFSEKELSVEVKENSLHVEGKKEKESDSFYHKQIADRSFRKIFKLHEKVIVDGADLKDGILTIKYHREIPESEKPRQISIKKA